MARRYHPADGDRRQSLTILVSQNPTTAVQSLTPVWPPASRQLKARRRPRLLQRWPDRNKFSVVAVASVFSLVTILALLALCRISQRRLNSGAAARRSLSDAQDDEERSDILEECLDLEEELGLGVVASTHVEESTETKTRLATMLYKSATAFEQMRGRVSHRLHGEFQVPAPKIPRLNEAWPFSPQLQWHFSAYSAYPSKVQMGYASSASGPDSWATEDVTVSLDEGGHQQHLPKVDQMPEFQRSTSFLPSHPPVFANAGAAARPLAALPVGRAKSGENEFSPDAWLDDPVTSTYPQISQQGAVGSESGHQRVEAPSAATASAESSGTFKERAGKPARRTPHVATGQALVPPAIQSTAAQPVEQPDDAFAASRETVKMSAPATYARATDDEGRGLCEAGGICRHPFVRLPVVNKENVRRSFNEEFALSFDRKITSPMEIYTTMRSLFAKASLTAEDVEKLMTEAELLTNYAAYKVARSYKRSTPSYLLMRLSSVFMVFDHLVCTIELFGDKMNTDSWWGAFASKFHTDFAFPEEGRPRTKKLYRLVNKLSAALSVYKQGRRPGLRKIIELKRVVITQAYKDSQLSNPLWSLWIQDDEEFSFSSDDWDGPSGVQTYDQREEKPS